jgi:hypothetical protein
MKGYCAEAAHEAGPGHQQTGQALVAGAQRIANARRRCQPIKDLRKPDDELGGIDPAGIARDQCAHYKKLQGRSASAARR